MKNIFKGPCVAAALFFLSLFFSDACLAEKLPVVASIFPVADMVHQVGGVHVSVTYLIPAGASPHTFEPRPSQLRQIAQAKVFFMIGASLEIWAERFVTAAGKNLAVVNLSDGVTSIETARADHHNGDHPEQFSAFKTGSIPADGKTLGVNPHIWLDPEIAKLMTNRIINVLSEIDPAHEDDYKKQGRTFLERITELDVQIKSTVDNFIQKKYVAFHPAWDYFARRYGLESVGIIATAPGKNPTPKKVKEIVTNIERFGIRAVFAEPQLNPKVAVVIAKEANVKVLMLDPMGDPAIKDRSTYIDLMGYNLKILKEAMQ